MKSKTKQQSYWYQRHHRQVVAFAAVCVAIAGLYFLAQQPYSRSNPAPRVTEVADVSTTTGDTKMLASASPERIRIPAIGVDTVFEAPLGLNDDQTIEVPDSYEEVGWYKYGPTPGELGPAVVLGHVDSYLGPAVFYSLGQLEEGDKIYVDRADDSTVTFEVTRLERHSQESFPTAAVYGDIDHAGLRLITCTGVYDHSTLRYTHNLIVFAELVDS